MNPEQPRVLAFHRRFDVHVVEGEGVYLVSEREMIQLSGLLSAEIAPRIDGAVSMDGLVAALSPTVPEDVARAAVGHLIENGFVAEEEPDFFAAEPDTSLYEIVGTDRRVALERLRNAKVVVQIVGDVEATGIIAHLHAGGVGEVFLANDQPPALGAATLFLVLADDYRRPELGAINETCIRNRQPWLLARPVGASLWIGPAFHQPSESACWACLENRIQANAEGHSYLQGLLIPDRPVGTSRVRNFAGTAAGDALVALEVLKNVATSDLPTADLTKAEIRTLDLTSFAIERHAVTRRPQCPVCGDPALMAAQAVKPIVFERRPKSDSTDGGHRAQNPEQVIERYRDQISPISGVVKSVDRIRVADTPLWVFMAGQNLARKTHSFQYLERGLRSSSCGKGMSETQARASAIGEAIERSSGVFQGDELRRRGRFDEFGGDAIHPKDCLLYSDRQYEYRHLWNLGPSNFRTVLEPFDKNWSIDWSPVWSLTAGKPRWLPTQYLYYGYPTGDTPWSGHADSNGAAAGSTLEDAVLQGFCELIERDAVAIWWYNRLRRPGIDLDSFSEPYLDRLRQTYASLGREVWALDLTSDFGIPTIVALSRAMDSETEDILFAFGSHLDPRVALLRAMNEMNQFLTAFVPGSDGISLSANADEELVNWCRVATLENQPYLVPDDRIPARRPDSWPRQSSDNLADDLALCRRLVEERNLEFLVLDQTRPDVGMPVVKVIVPGMRHYWARFAPGRLYDVPVELGWQSHRTEEEDLNPIPIFV